MWIPDPALDSSLFIARTHALYLNRPSIVNNAARTWTVLAAPHWRSKIRAHTPHAADREDSASTTERPPHPNPGTMPRHAPSIPDTSAVRELVRDDVERPGVPRDDDPVAVAVHHLRAVPERIVELLSVMHGSDEL